MNLKSIVKFLTHQKSDNKLNIILNHKIKSISNTNKDQHRNQDNKIMMLK